MSVKARNCVSSDFLVNFSNFRAWNEFPGTELEPRILQLWEIQVRLMTDLHEPIWSYPALYVFSLDTRNNACIDNVIVVS
jgi:GTP cyclohydrolase III